MPTLTGAFNRISSSPLSSAFTQLTVILQRVEGSACPLHFPNFRNPTNPTCSFSLSGQEGGKGHSTHVEVKGRLVGVSFLTT